MRKMFLKISMLLILLVALASTVYAEGFLSPDQSIDDATSGVKSFRELTDNNNFNGNVTAPSPAIFWIVFFVAVGATFGVLYFLKKSKIEILRMVLIVGGILLGIHALVMDVSLQVSYPMGNAFGLPERVNNLGLMNERQNFLIIAGLFIIVGVMMFFLGNFNKAATEENGKQCPECAEKVKKEAKTCRFCKYKFIS